MHDITMVYVLKTWHYHEKCSYAWYYYGTCLKTWHYHEKSP